MSEAKIPYKIYLSEENMPKAWYNLRADINVIKLRRDKNRIPCS